MYVTINRFATEKPVVPGFQIKLEFGNIVFVEGGKPESKQSKSKEREEG